MLGNYRPNVSSAAECREIGLDSYQDYRISLLGDIGEKSTPQNQFRTEERNDTAFYTFETIYRFVDAYGKLSHTQFKNMDAYIYHEDYCFELNMLDYNYQGDPTKYYEIIDTIKVLPAEVPPEGKNVYSKDKYDLD